MNAFRRNVYTVRPSIRPPSVENARRPRTHRSFYSHVCVFVSQGLKGVGAKIVILEEASRLDRAVFTEVVVPLLGVKDTAVLAISTPLDENNFYSQMLEMTHNDGVTPLFNVISVSLICDECKQKELKGQLTCPHRQNEIPPCGAVLYSATHETIITVQQRDADGKQRNVKAWSKSCWKTIQKCASSFFCAIQRKKLKRKMQVQARAIGNGDEK